MRRISSRTHISVITGCFKGPESLVFNMFPLVGNIFYGFLKGSVYLPVLCVLHHFGFSQDTKDII